MNLVVGKPTPWARAERSGLDGEPLGCSSGTLWDILGQGILRPTSHPTCGLPLPLMSAFPCLSCHICHFLYPCLEMYFLIDWTNSRCAHRTWGVGETRSLHQPSILWRGVLMLEQPFSYSPLASSPHSLHGTRTNHLLHSSIRTPRAWPTPRLLLFALQEGIPQNRNYLNLPSILQNSYSLTWIGKTFAQLSTTEKSRQSWHRSPRLFPVLLEEQSSPPRRLNNRPFSAQQYLDLWCLRLEAKSH